MTERRDLHLTAHETLRLGYSGRGCSKRTAPRRLRILNTVFKEIERLGHLVKVDQKRLGGVYFEIAGERLDFRLSERRKQVEIPLSNEERRYSWNANRTTKTELEWTAELIFEVETYIPLRKRWRDRKKARLEDQLDQLITGLVEVAAAEKEAERLRQENTLDGRKLSVNARSRSVWHASKQLVGGTSWR